VMLSCVRAVVGRLVRLAGLGTGLRIAFGGIRFRISAAGLFRSHYKKYNG